MKNINIIARLTVPFPSEFKTEAALNLYLDQLSWCEQLKAKNFLVQRNEDVVKEKSVLMIELKKMPGGNERYLIPREPPKSLIGTQDLEFFIGFEYELLHPFKKIAVCNIYGGDILTPQSNNKTTGNFLIKDGFTVVTLEEHPQTHRREIKIEEFFIRDYFCSKKYGLVKELAEHEPWCRKLKRNKRLPDGLEQYTSTVNELASKPHAVYKNLFQYV